MKIWKRGIAFMLALCMALSMTAFAGYEDYSDVDEITYVEAVDVLSELGIIEGDEDGALNPHILLTRAMTTKLITYTLLGKKAAEALQPEEDLFTDIPASHWAAGYIAYCIDMGFVSGKGDGTFRPDETVTASQFAKILLCTAGYGQMGEFADIYNNGTVNALATKLGIFDGNLDVVFAETVTFEEACLYTFNMLTRVMQVTYDEETDSYYAGTAPGAVTDFDFNETLGAKLYDLSKQTTTDVYGRPCYRWYKNIKQLTGMYAEMAGGYYTKAVSAKTLYKDLDLEEATNASIIRNGTYTGNFLIEAGSSTKIGGNGVWIEAYVYDAMVESEMGSYVETFVELILIDTYLAQVTNMEDGDVTVDIWMNGDGTTTTMTAYGASMALRVGDYVLVNTAFDQIWGIWVPDMVTGMLEVTSGSGITLGGEVYYHAYNLDKTTEETYSEQFGTEMLVLLDDYGYVMGMVPVPETGSEERGIEYTLSDIRLYDVDTGDELTEIPEGQFIAEVQIGNIGSTEADTIMLVLYSHDGQMLDAKYTYNTVEPGETKSFRPLIDNTDGKIGDIKAFVLSDDGKLTPLAKAVAFGEQSAEEHEPEGYVLVTDSELSLGGLVSADKALVEVLHLDGTGYEVLDLLTRRTTVDGVRVTQYKDTNGSWVNIDTDGRFIEYGFYGYYMTEDGAIVLMDLGTDGRGEVQALARYGGAVSADGSSQKLTFNGSEQELIMDNDTRFHVVDDNDIRTCEGYKNIKIDLSNVDALVIYDNGTTVEELYVIDNGFGNVETYAYWNGEFDSGSHGTEVKLYHDGEYAWYGLTGMELTTKEEVAQRMLRLAGYGSDTSLSGEGIYKFEIDPDDRELVDGELIKDESDSIRTVLSAKAAYFTLVESDQEKAYADGVQIYDLRDGGAEAELAKSDQILFVGDGNNLVSLIYIIGSVRTPVVEDEVTTYTITYHENGYLTVTGTKVSDVVEIVVQKREGDAFGYVKTITTGIDYLLANTWHQCDVQNAISAEGIYVFQVYVNGEVVGTTQTIVF